MAWLAERGLALSAEKTRIVHLHEGFDFLGFNIRHYAAPLTSRSGWKLLIRPSRDAVKRLKVQLRALWRQGSGQNARVVIQMLNPVIRGWANYYRGAVAKRLFGDLDHWLHIRARRWARRNHPGRGHGWTVRRYFGRFRQGSTDRWVFGDGPGLYLLKFAWTPIRRHILVPGRASPDDPGLRDYWDRRRMVGCHLLPRRQEWLARRQRGNCLVCKADLLNGEELQIHHVVPRSAGGDDDLRNLRLVHLFCHQRLHAGGTRDA